MLSSSSTQDTGWSQREELCSGGAGQKPQSVSVRLCVAVAAVGITETQRERV